MKSIILLTLLVISLPLFAQTKGLSSLTNDERSEYFPLVDDKLDAGEGKVNPIWAFYSLQDFFRNLSPENELIDTLTEAGSKKEYLDWVLKYANYAFVRAYVQEISIAFESLQQNATKKQINLAVDGMRDLRDAIHPSIAIDSSELEDIRMAAASVGIEVQKYDEEQENLLLDNINSFEFWKQITISESPPTELADLLNVLQVKAWLLYICENELPIKLVQSYKIKLLDFFARWGI